MVELYQHHIENLLLEGLFFLNFVRDYPDQFFTGLIWMDRAKDNFSYKPDKKLRRKRICVKGRIQQYNNIPQIVINTEKQISFDDS